MNMFDLQNRSFYTFLFFIIAVVVVSTSWSCLEDEKTMILKDEEQIKVVDATYTYLALGDSYTIGEGVAAEKRWPNQLSQLLNQKGKKIDEVNIIARTGWTTRNLLDAIERENPSNYSLVSLLIGVNNQYQGLHFDQFKTEFDSLLNIAIGITGNKDYVFVLSIPDYGVTPFGSGNRVRIAKELNKYNAYIKQRCMTESIGFVDITGISRELGSSNEALSSDQLHPSGFQYSKWVEKAFPMVLELLDQ